MSSTSETPWRKPVEVWNNSCFWKGPKFWKQRTPATEEWLRWRPLTTKDRLPGTQLEEGTWGLEARDLCGSGLVLVHLIHPSRSISAFSFICPLGGWRLQMVAGLPGSLASFRLGQWWRIKSWKERSKGGYSCLSWPLPYSRQDSGGCYVPLSLGLSRSDPISRVMVLYWTTVCSHFLFRLRSGKSFLLLLVSGASLEHSLFFNPAHCEIVPSFRSCQSLWVSLLFVAWTLTEIKIKVKAFTNCAWTLMSSRL